MFANDCTGTFVFVFSSTFLIEDWTFVILDRRYCIFEHILNEHYMRA